MEVFMQEGMVANKTQLIIFGDLPGSMVEKPESGQSIVRIEGMEQWYVLDDSPTIGALNDLEGVAGIISGTIFHQGNPIWESKKFWFDFSFKLQAAGTYECRVLKGNRQFSKIGRAYSWDEGCEWFSIEPIDIMIEADSIYTQVDIIITDPTFVNITDNYRKDITCYPNPASDKIYINGTFLTGARVCLSDLKGSVIQEFKLNAFSGKQELTLQKNLTGIYVLTINENGQTTFSDQLLINPFK